jgi:hypothetical protein
MHFSALLAGALATSVTVNALPATGSHSNSVDLDSKKLDASSSSSSKSNSLISGPLMVDNSRIGPRKHSHDQLADVNQRITDKVFNDIADRFGAQHLSSRDDTNQPGGHHHEDKSNRVHPEAIQNNDSSKHIHGPASETHSPVNNHPEDSSKTDNSTNTQTDSQSHNRPVDIDSKKDDHHTTTTVDKGDKSKTNSDNDNRKCGPGAGNDVHNDQKKYGDGSGKKIKTDIGKTKTNVTDSLKNNNNNSQKNGRKSHKPVDFKNTAPIKLDKSGNNTITSESKSDSSSHDSHEGTPSRSETPSQVFETSPTLN